MTAMNPAVVVALDCITGLQTARILTARGVAVTGIAADRRHFCARTRAVARVVESPTAGDALIATLERLGPKLGQTAFLVPCSDTSVLTISAERERLAPWYRFVLPPHDVVQRLVDKIAFTELAQASGLAIPETRVLRSRADAEAAADALDYPAVIKPGVKTAGWQAATKAKAFRVETADELLATYDRAAGWTEALIAQAWVDGVDTGPVHGERLLRPGGRTRWSRSSPGRSVSGRSRPAPAVSESRSAMTSSATQAVRMFASVDYQGIGYVEMKRDARTGDYLIIEANIGRPTGRSATAERAGVEFLMTAYRDALGQPLPEARTQRYRGIKWIYLRHDLQASVVAARAGRLSLRGWWRSVRGPKVEAVGSWRDPVPFLADVGRTLTAGAGLVRRRSTQRHAPDPAQAKL